MSALEVLVSTLHEGGVLRVYDLGDVPSKPTYPYAVLSSAPGAPAIRTLDGSGDPLGRFTVQHYARTAEAIEDLAAITFATFDARELDLPGSPVCWQELATTPYRDPDDRGVLNVLHTYRY